MAVMYGARMSAHCFSSQVGSGSRQDCLLEESHISFWTSSNVSERNDGKSAHESSGAENTVGDGAFCVERRTSSTFLVKLVAKSSLVGAASLPYLPMGRGMQGERERAAPGGRGWRSARVRCQISTSYNFITVSRNPMNIGSVTTKICTRY